MPWISLEFDLNLIKNYMIFLQTNRNISLNYIKLQFKIITDNEIYFNL